MSAYLAIARLWIPKRFRSPTRPPNGVRRVIIGDGLVMDDTGWLWGSECKVRVLKKAEQPLTEEVVWPVTPLMWDGLAKRNGFQP